MQDLNSTPRANRLHIGIFGKRNSGKSTLINALTGQQTAIVSDVAGTTTDAVYKAMEIPNIGACVIIDTAGFDDVGQLGGKRIEKTVQAAEKTDIAVILCADDDLTLEAEWYEVFRKAKTPVIFAVNKSDILSNPEEIAEKISNMTGIQPVLISAAENIGIDALTDKITALIPEDYEIREITGGLINAGETALLVMPQDIAAPKGRLILPQVQTIRELLDKKCVTVCVTADNFLNGINTLKTLPQLIITDSQVFKFVYDNKPSQSKITSFSVLFAALKGDMDYFIKSADVIDRLTENSRVLIAEACTHAPLEEDIGRVKIPAALRRKVGNGLAIDMVSGADFPQDLSKYDLIIHCGACMFNRKHVISRTQRAKQQNVPMSNYGIVLAKLAGILDKIDLPKF